MVSPGVMRKECKEDKIEDGEGCAVKDAEEG
jgi:hypothetical protein